MPMLREHPWGLYFRASSVVLLIALLNLAPGRHSFHQALDQARQSLQQNDSAKASQHIEQAATEMPWRTDLHMLAARYALQGGNATQAIHILEQPQVAVKLLPNDLLVLGDAYKQSGDTNTAATIWQRVAELSPSPEVYQRLGDYYQARENYSTAIEYLHRLLKYKPADANLNFHLGLLYATLDPEASLAYLAQAAELDPNLAPSALQLQRKIRTATLFDEPAYTFTAVGRELAKLDEWNLAEAAFLKATQLRPDYAEAWAFLGEARQHIPSAATLQYAGLPELQKAFMLDPESIAVNLLQGLYWSRQGDYPLANSYFQTTISLDPSNPLLYAELANNLALQGDLPAAQIAYQYAISLAPEDPFFYRLLAEFSLNHRIQIREIALPAARTAVALSPDDPRSLDVLAQALLSLEDTLNAERLLLQALAIDPNYAPAHLHIGMIYAQRGEMDRGRQEFNIAESLGTGSWIAAQAQRFLDYYYP